MKLKIIHKQWEDNVYLNENKKELYREYNKNEKAKYKLESNILYIYWYNWDMEVFVYYDNNFYYTENINLIINENEEDCYIDYINNIIYKKSDNNYGIIEFDNNDLIITWNEIDKEKILFKKNNISLIIDNYDNLDNDNNIDQKDLNNSLLLQEINHNNNDLNQNISITYNIINNKQLINFNNENDKIPNIFHFIFNKYV